jgi:hypothetical protein
MEEEDVERERGFLAVETLSKSLTRIESFGIQ